MSAARLGIERLHDRFLDPGFNLFQRLGSGFLVQSLKYGLALVGRQIFDDVGDIGRMQFGQTIVGNLQLYAPRRISLNHVDELPGIFRGRNPPEQAPARRRAEQLLAADGEPRRAHHIHGKHAQGWDGPTRSFCVSNSRSTSLTRTTFRPLTSMTC